MNTTEEEKNLQIRKEALLNEYKGNLFEFLVALEFAKKFSLQTQTLEGISKGAFEMLKQQEEYIRSYYPSLLTKLPFLAK